MKKLIIIASLTFLGHLAVAQQTVSAGRNGRPITKADSTYIMAVSKNKEVRQVIQNRISIYNNATADHILAILNARDKQIALRKFITKH